MAELDDLPATPPKDYVVSFPNNSRSFDATRNRVRFWGYVSAIEISFFVEEDALRKLSPKTEDTEEAYLKVFDGAQERIRDVANMVYVRGKKGSYVLALAAKDF